MQRNITLIGLLLLTFTLSSCSQPVATVTPRLVNYTEVPCTVDLIADSEGKLAVIKWPVASIKAEINNPNAAKSIIDNTSYAGITITGLKATFEYQNKSLFAAAMPEYNADLSVHIKANETVGFPISFFDDAQRTIARDTFTNAANNSQVFLGSTVTVTFYGTDDNGNKFELKTSFTTLWGNWAT